MSRTCSFVAVMLASGRAVCRWCAEGWPRVVSSVNERAMVHPGVVGVGRAVCEAPNAKLIPEERIKAGREGHTCKRRG